MMTDTNRQDATTAATDETTTATPALPKSSTITLTAPDGSVMQIIAERKGGAAKTYVITTKDKKAARGMSQTHDSFDAAKAATEKMAKAAEKLGWQRKVTRKGFVAKPDAFSTLPAAPKAEK